MEHGLLKELPIKGAATVFDSNPPTYHHLDNVDDVIVRVRSRRAPHSPASLSAHLALQVVR